MPTIMDVPGTVLEHIFALSQNICPIARVCRQWRALMVAKAEKHIGDMGPLHEGETPMVVWKIKRRMDVARAISSKVSIDRQGYFFVFVGTRDDDRSEGVYLLGHDLNGIVDERHASNPVTLSSIYGTNTFYGSPQRISRSLDAEGRFVDLPAPIVSVCGAMMMDTAGKVHTFTEATDDSQVYFPEEEVCALGAHTEHVGIVTKDGALLTGGRNDIYPKLGYWAGEDIQQDVRPVKMDQDDVRVSMVALGFEFSLALDVDGRVYAWGSGEEGCLGCATVDIISHEDNYSILKKDVEFEEADKYIDEFGGDDDAYPGRILPRRMDFDVTVRYIAAGDTFSMLLTSEGRLFGCGNNAWGQLGTGDRIRRYTPQEISGSWLRACHVACGQYHSVVLAVRDDRCGVWTSGKNENGQLGLGRRSIYKSEFTRVTLLDDVDVASVCAGHDSSVAVTVLGDIYVWGDTLTGSYHVPLYSSQYQPTKLQHCRVSVPSNTI